MAYKENMCTRTQICTACFMNSLFRFLEVMCSACAICKNVKSIHRHKNKGQVYEQKKTHIRILFLQTISLTSDCDVTNERKVISSDSCMQLHACFTIHPGTDTVLLTKDTLFFNETTDTCFHRIGLSTGFRLFPCSLHFKSFFQSVFSELTQRPLC